MRISVIGTGYLGAVHAVCMAHFGHDVIGIDTDPDKITALSEGRAPFFEPGLPALLNEGVREGRLRFSTDIADAVEADIHFLCVGTPQLPGSEAADTRYLDAVVDALAPLLTRRCLVVGKSTVPVGTAQRLTERIQLAAPAGTEVDLVWNPEFLREGFAVEDTLRPDRIVVGSAREGADRPLRRCYEQIMAGETPYLATDLVTAELVKVAANSFLATKISFINAMAEVCEAAGADVVQLADAIGRDERIGGRFLRSGIGFGGGCLGKDIRAFRARATELGVGEAVGFLGEVDEINTRRRQRAVDLATHMVGGDLVGGDLAGSRIAVLGAAFKPNSDDVRDSAALWVAVRLAERGAQVRIHDPEAMDNARAVAPQLDYADTPQKAVEGVDLVIHLTEWSQYRDLDPRELTELVREARLLDGRNTLDVGRWQSAGWTVAALGRSLMAA